MSRISRDLAAHHSHSRSPMRALSSVRSVGSKMPRVAVVGAGLAGLRCADVLLRNGANVTIFEARNRVGGRVHQCTFHGHTFDMGPNWIHGTEGNPMMKLAEKTGTVILEPEEKQLIVDSTGKCKSEDEAYELGTGTWATVMDAFKYSNEHCTEIDPQTSLFDFFREAVTKRFPDDAHQVRERLNEARMWGPFVGDAIDKQSLRNFFLEECLEGENVIVASTYEKILAEVSRTARKEADIKFDTEVVKIEYRGIDNSSTKVVLTTAGGERHAFDEIVITCPLGWLKRYQAAAFSPSLPPRLTQAIDNISYGHLEKIYVTFASAWWKAELKNGMLNGSLNGSVNHAHEKQSGADSTPLFIHFHHPTYHATPESKQTEVWNQSVVSMAHFPGSTAKPTLLFYMYGACSLYVTSMIATHERGSTMYNSILSDFIEPFISKLPNYSASNPVCTPSSLLATEWSNDRHAGYGSYSNFQVGLVQGDEDIKYMREADGLSEQGRGLWFAGEHTAPFVAIGTTTGAYWSGESVARKILDRYGVDNIKTGDEELNGVNGTCHKKKLDRDVMDGANLSALAI